jgi:spore coat polysaccharide biosynthesis predicted glycosyltransferase SpsG
MRDVPDMAELMSWADIAIAAGGTTCWELAFMGVPFIGLSRAKQEEILLQKTTRMGISLNLGDHKDLEPCKIVEALAGLLSDKRLCSAMSFAGHLYIDGLGPKRNINTMSEGEI